MNHDAITEVEFEKQLLNARRNYKHKSKGKLNA